MNQAIYHNIFLIFLFLLLRTEVGKVKVTYCILKFRESINITQLKTVTMSLIGHCTPPAQFDIYSTAY